MPFNFLKGIKVVTGSITGVEVNSVTANAVVGTTSSSSAGAAISAIASGTGTVALSAVASTNGTALYGNAPSTGFAVDAQGPVRATQLITASGGIQLPVGNSPAGTSSGYVQAATDHGLVFNDAGTLRIGRTIEHGTSFPGSPYDTQLYFRDDLFCLYQYDSSTFSGPSGNWYKVGAGAKDTLTRSDSTTNPGRTQTGQYWYPQASTQQGIRTNQGYFQTDTNLDAGLLKTYGCDQPVAQVQIAGTLNSSTNYRFLALLLHYFDSSNFVGVDIFNGSVRLYRYDAGVVTVFFSTASTVVDGTFYTLCAAQSGTTVTVYKNGVSINSADIFSASNYKVQQADTCGMQLAKAGAPATAANFKNYVVRQAA